MKLIPFILLTWSMYFSNEARAQVQPGTESSYSDIVTLDAVTFKQYMDDPSMDWFDAVVDVRTYNEWESGHIPNATLVENLASYNPSSNATIGTPANLAGCEYCSIAVYCNSGSRAGVALQILRNAGYVGRLYNALGVSQWISAGFPLVTTLESATPPCKGNGTASEQCRLSYLAYSGEDTVGSNTTGAVSTTNNATVADSNTTNSTADDGNGPAASSNTTDSGSGPAPPPQSVTDNRTCAAHSACVASNLTGLCCPTSENWLLDCCEGAVPEPTCELNQNCSALGLTGACCPTNTGFGHLDCCNAFPNDCANGTCTVTESSVYLEFLADNGVSGCHTSRLSMLLASFLLSAAWFLF